MDTVVASSTMVPEWISAQLTMTGTLWTMRVLRLLAPEVGMGGAMSRTGEALSRGPARAQLADATKRIAYARTTTCGSG